MSDPTTLMMQQHQQQQDPESFIGAYQPIGAVNTSEHRYTVPIMSITKDPASGKVYKDPGEVMVREVTTQIFGRHFAYVHLYFMRAYFKVPEGTVPGRGTRRFVEGHMGLNAGYSEPTWPLMQKWIKAAVNALIQQAIGGQPTLVTLDANGDPVKMPTDDQMIAAYEMASKAAEVTAKTMRAETQPLTPEEAALGPGSPVPPGLPEGVDMASFQSEFAQQAIAQQQASIDAAKAAGRNVRPSGHTADPVGAPQAVPVAPQGAPQPASADGPAIELPGQ